jgi:hypothetical protein
MLSSLRSALSRACTALVTVPSRGMRSRGPSTHTAGHYLPPPSKNNIWSRKYTHLDYCKIVHPLTGTRQGMETAFWRFKRLDWGMYIRPMAGRWKKHWKARPETLWNKEQHIFCKPFHVRRFERMFHSEWKAKRYLPDDIYDKYNRTSFQKHKSTKHKNKARIDEYGSNEYRFNKHKPNLLKHMSKYNRSEKNHYEPPGYMANICSNGGVYEKEFVPENKPAPHFQRPPIQSKAFMKDYRRRSVQVMEPFGGYLDSWHPLNKDMFKNY